MIKITTILFALALFVSCGGAGQDEDPSEYEKLRHQYNLNLVIWEASDTKHYSLTVNAYWSCDEISNEEHSTNEQSSNDGKKVEDLFEEVSELIDMEPYKLFVTYDEEYGFPTKIHYDLYETIEDDFMCIIVSDFTPRVVLINQS